MTIEAIRSMAAIMKKLTSLILLLFLVLSAQAEHLIYRSLGRQTIYGNGKIVRLVVQGYLLLDAGASFGNPVKATAVAGFSLNGVKIYSVVPLQDYRIDTVSGPNGSVYTTISKAQSPGTQFQGVLLEFVYLRGKSQSIQIAPQATVFLPKVFNSSARAIADGPPKTVGEVTGSYTYDQRATFISNQLETFEQAVERLSDGFAGRGYTRFFPPPAE